MDHTRFITTTTTHQTPIYSSYPISTTPYSYLIPQHPTIPNHNPITTHELYRSTIQPPGVEPYPYLNHSHQAPVEGYSYYSASDSVPIAPPPYYQDANGARNSVTMIEAVRQYGVDPAAYGIGYGVTIPSNGTGHVAAHIPNSTLWTNPAAQPRQKGIWKRAPKKTTIVQSLHCGICKVDCSSRVVYEHHILGKKHKKVMEKINELIITHAPSTSAAVSNNNPIIGPLEKPAGMRQKPSRSKGTISLQEFETKKRKVLEGGAAAHAVRTCTVCNVVCNSDVVFSHHLSGHKHAAMVEKYRTSAAAVGNNVTDLASRFIL